ncbi:hypothetical protein HK407_01g02400 [Ordospora pajunii]|uniref:uncharacterized protein n=1 Tax=Ordospora pajunii TaxID=3039483 RepID=UPI0029527E2B|nr:uncharacterized protein HK407_01g02400 [Ordospora pajunii]KAH9412345.1 hypothetical protein HK407_01g02400 [Ordospora pajunii]
MSTTNKRFRNIIVGAIFGMAFTMITLYFLRILFEYQQRTHNCQVFFEYFDKFREVKNGAENKDVFDAIQSIIGVDASILEGMYSERMMIAGEVDNVNSLGCKYFKEAIAKANQTLFTSQELKKVMDDIMTFENVNVLIAKELMLRQEKKCQSEAISTKKVDKGSGEQENDATNIDILVKAFIYILVKENLNTSIYQSYLDHINNDDDVTKNHISKISMSKDLLAIEIAIKGSNSDSPISIYNFMRIVMLEINNLIPRIISESK